MKLYICSTFILAALLAGCASNQSAQKAQAQLTRDTFSYSGKLREYCLAPWLLFGSQLTAYESVIAQLHSGDKKSLPSDHELIKTLDTVMDKVSQMDFNLVRYRPNVIDPRRIRQIASSEKQVSRCPTLINTVMNIRKAEWLGAESQDATHLLKEYTQALQSTFGLVMNVDEDKKSSGSMAGLESFTYYGFDLLIYIFDQMLRIANEQEADPNKQPTLDSLKEKMAGSKGQLAYQVKLLGAINVIYNPQYKNTVESKIAVWDKKITAYSNSLHSVLLDSIKQLEQSTGNYELLFQQQTLLFPKLVSGAITVTSLRSQYFSIITDMAKAKQTKK